MRYICVHWSVLVPCWVCKSWNAKLFFPWKSLETVQYLFTMGRWMLVRDSVHDISLQLTQDFPGVAILFYIVAVERVILSFFVTWPRATGAFLHDPIRDQWPCWKRCISKYCVHSVWAQTVFNLLTVRQWHVKGTICVFAQYLYKAQIQRPDVWSFRSLLHSFCIKCNFSNVYYHLFMLSRVTLTTAQWLDYGLIPTSFCIGFGDSNA